MSLRSKLAILFLSIAAIPLLLVSALTYTNFKNSLEANRFAQLVDLSIFRADKIEMYFAGLKSDIAISQGFYNVKRNLPVLTRLAQRPDNPQAVAARKMLADQLLQMQAVSNMTDIMLVSPDGKIAYANRREHFPKDLSRGSDVERDAIEKGRSGIYFSDIYRDTSEDKRFEMLVTAPATDFEGRFTGVIAFEVDMTPVYKLIQDVTGLGSTGEVLVGRKRGNQVEFLNPLRHDPRAALRRKATVGDTTSFPIQQAVLGKTGSGVAIDYRGKQVIAAWRYIPSMQWGLVAKIDINEAFADVVNLRNLVWIILAIVLALSGVIAFSIAQSISVPIKNLTKGAQIIGSGNLDYKVGTNLKDEIGQLSRSFDKMTHDVKAITASRDELNKEVAERKRAEESLRESEERFRVIADASPAMISVSRIEDGFLLFTNPEYERALGFAKGELIGRKSPDLYFDPADRAAIIKTIEEKGTIRNFEVRMRRKDGAPVWISSSVNPIRFGGGPALLATSIDISDRKRAEEALRVRTEELKARNDELSFFNRSMVDREERMIELKKQINELCKQLGRPAAYDVDFGEEKQ